MTSETEIPRALETAARVLRIEGAAVLALAAALPDGLAEAVDRVLACRGRVIVSGIGKSGHVARKIAATFSSTGTPALFVHPAEASHGDLGAITEADLCLVLSNSGETSELSDLIAHTRRFGIGLIAMTGRADSTLGRAADLTLAMPAAPEACIIGLAPTTSTTMALALGDALAVAVMERRGFAPGDFHAFHPGGRLGARLVRVDRLMRTGALPLVPDDRPMTDVLDAMTQGGAGIAGLTRAGTLVGVITDGDLRRNARGLLERRAREVATMAPLTAPPGMLASEAVALMNARKITQLFVVQDGTPVGLLHIHDCLRAGVDG
jgi:arabinose-5-phosphate isomerase